MFEPLRIEEVFGDWQREEPVGSGLKPDILCHPNIPHPLHGLAPRTIMGRTWWDRTRKEAYARYDFHCVACGIHKLGTRRKWLEAHEFWHINYETGLCSISSIEPLCHMCHNFIHSGRLRAIMDTPRERGGKPSDEVKEIIQHGVEILRSNKLKVFFGTAEFAKEMGWASIPKKEIQPMPKKIAPWGAFKLEWEGKVYDGWESVEEWADHYKVTDEDRKREIAEWYGSNQHGSS